MISRTLFTTVANLVTTFGRPQTNRLTNIFQKNANLSISSPAFLRSISLPKVYFPAKVDPTSAELFENRLLQVGVSK